KFIFVLCWCRKLLFFKFLFVVFELFIYFFTFCQHLIVDKTNATKRFANNSSCSLFGYKRNLKALFCLVISNHLTLATNTSSLFVYCTISFGYRQPTFISHLLIGLSPCTFLKDGRLLSEKVKKIARYGGKEVCNDEKASTARFARLGGHFLGRQLRHRTSRSK